MLKIRKCMLRDPQIRAEQKPIKVEKLLFPPKTKEIHYFRLNVIVVQYRYL